MENVQKYFLKADENGAHLEGPDTNGPLKFGEWNYKGNMESTLQKYDSTLTQINGVLKTRYKPHNISNESLYQLYQTKHDIKSAIRIKKKDTKTQWIHHEIIKTMSSILADAINETKKTIPDSSNLFTNKHFIEYVINFAQEQGGVGNVGLEEWKGTPDQFKIAKELSRQYQIAAQRRGFLTGRTENLKTLVGQRLCRIPINDTKKIVNGALDQCQAQAKE